MVVVMILLRQSGFKIFGFVNFFAKHEKILHWNKDT